MTLKERAAKRLTEWKKDVDQLKNQLEHTKEESKETFEKQKKSMVKWIDNVKEKIDEVEDFGEEKVDVLKGKMEEVRLHAALGRAEAEDEWKEQQKKLNKSIQDLKMSVSKMEKGVEGNAKTLLENTKYTLDGFYTKFDLLRLKLASGKDETIQVWQDRKEEILKNISKLNAKIEIQKDKIEDKWENFSDELGEAWDHLKKAIKD